MISDIEIDNKNIEDDGVRRWRRSTLSPKTPTNTVLHAILLSSVTVTEI